MAKTKTQLRYFISTNDGPYAEVTVKEFANAERKGGYQNTGTGPTATFGFSTSSRDGSIRGTIATNDEQVAKLLNPED